MNVATQKYSEYRKHNRIEMVGRVFIHNEEHLYIAPLQNISLGGVFVERVVTIKVGQEVRIVVKAPGLSEPIQAIGRVVRIENGERMGSAIQFDWIGPRFEEVLGSHPSSG